MSTGSIGSTRARARWAPLALLVGASLAACSSSTPTTAPTAKVTTPPAATQAAATQAAATQAAASQAAASQAAATTAATPGGTAPGGGGSAPQGAAFCSGMNITFFPGGAPGGGFETVVYNGAKAAESAFGPTITYQWSNWDPAQMISQFNEAMATNPDGIAIMGHPGDEAFDPLIDQARSQGILVTVMNTELPLAQAKYAADGTGYVGAVLHDAGAALANEAITRGNLKSGDKVFVWGLKAVPGRGERTKGVTDTLEAAGIDVVYLEIDRATDADASAGVPIFTGMASANPDLKAIITDHGNVTSTIPTYMAAANMAPGSVFAAGFDLSAATVQGIKDGYIDVVIDQQQYLQGFEAVEQLCLTHAYGFSGLNINTGAGFVDASNVDLVKPLVDQQIR